MNKTNEILHRISLIRNSHSVMVDIFTKGSCYNMYMILHALYPDAIAYYDGDHVVTKIGNNLYDINGIVRNKNNYIPLCDKSSISKLHRSMKCKFTGIGENPIVIEYEKGKGFSLHDPNKKENINNEELNKIKDNGTESTKQKTKR